MTCSTSLSGKKQDCPYRWYSDDCHNITRHLYRRSTVTGYDSFRLLADDGANRLIDHPAIISLCAISPLTAPVARRFGMERSLFAALLLICAGIAIRSLPSPYLLFGGTAVIGGGIALGNVLLRD